MAEVRLTVNSRVSKTRSHIHELRKQGKIPAVIYGQGVKSEPVEIDSRELHNILVKEGKNALIDLVLSGQKSAGKHVVMVKDLQRDPIGGRILHADLCKISLRDKIHATVPVLFTGESAGVSQGGILQHGLRALEIECLPAQIPEHLELDISSLNIGDHLTVASLPEHPDYRILSEPEGILVTVVAPRMAEQPETTEANGPVVASAAKADNTRETAGAE